MFVTCRKLSSDIHVSAAVSVVQIYLHDKIRKNEVISINLYVHLISTLLLLKAKIRYNLAKLWRRHSGTQCIECTAYIHCVSKNFTPFLFALISILNRF